MPDTWALPDSMPMLQGLYLQDNQLTGGLPAWGPADAVPSLRTLELSGNPLGGSLPGDWFGGTGAFPALQTL